MTTVEFGLIPGECGALERPDALRKRDASESENLQNSSTEPGY